MTTVERADGAVPLTEAAARELLSRCEIGRVAFVRAGQLSILPVTYAVDRGGHVGFRTAAGSKLYVAESEITEVAFEVDDIDPGTGAGEVAVVTGRMEAVLDIVEQASLAKLGLRPWADAVRKPAWVRIRTDRIEGWRSAEPA